jgi:hypothetical protein
MNYHRRLFSTAEWYTLRAASLLGQKDGFYSAYAALKSPRPDIERFAGAHRGGRCFILGGGPSLLKVDPDKIRNEITFGVNACFLIFERLGFQPTYYTVEDSLVYEDRRSEILEKVTESHCLFPIQFRSTSFDRSDFGYFRAVYDLDERPGWPRFSTDCSRVVWIAGTVTYVCLQLAFYMGFEEVYLVGMDHSYDKPAHTVEDGNVWNSQGADPNHFHPDYFGAGTRWHDPRLDRMERAYQTADKVFLDHGRKVLNATHGGALEIFERVDFDTLF